jgi:hypothetical protein
MKLAQALTVYDAMIPAEIAAPYRAAPRRQGAWMGQRSERTYWQTGRSLTFPLRCLLVVRVLSGWMNILAQLDCTVAVRGLARRRLPEFAERSSC